MEPRLYRTGEFAQRAGVSVRALRFYDRRGLLAPSARSISGHRLYADADLVALEKILAMKLLGFTLAEIKAMLTAGSAELPAALSQQRAMLRDRVRRLDRAIRAIDAVEARLRAGERSPELLLGIIEAMNANEDKAWMNEHLTPEQIEALAEISARVQSPELRERLAARAWSEADQARATEEWNAVYAEAARLAQFGADPEGPEGRALGGRYGALLEAWTGGDPEFAASLERFYAEAKRLPPEKSPYTGATQETMAFAERAYAAFRTRA